MKLLLGGALMALILLSELVGLVVLARHTLSADEAHQPAQEEGSFTTFVVAAAQEEGEGDYRWVEREGSSSCSVGDPEGGAAAWGELPRVPRRYHQRRRREGL
jgi:hypothetical protein